MAENKGLKQRLPLIGISIVMLIIVCVGLLFVLKSLKNKNSKPARTVQVVQVVRPPPPPPPPENQPPPPPPEKQEKYEQAEPEPTPDDDQSPAQDLGLDAAGTAGGDAFGLAARPGGHDMIGGNGTAPFGGYQARLSSQLNDRLSNEKNVKSKRFTVSVRLWIDREGRIGQVKIVDSTGDPGLDSAIQAAIVAINRLPEPPPVEMPQPITLRILRKS